jgi:hypothetical protein
VASPIWVLTVSIVHLGVVSLDIETHDTQLWSAHRTSFTRLWPSLAVIALFVLGASCSPRR